MYICDDFLKIFYSLFIIPKTKTMGNHINTMYSLNSPIP